MKLTIAQLNKLLNQHIGTGYIVLKTADNNIHITDIQLGPTGNWYAGLNGKPLDEKLTELANEITESL